VRPKRNGIAFRISYDAKEKTIAIEEGT
jgi:hypothetical protein